MAAVMDRPRVQGRRQSVSPDRNAEVVGLASSLPLLDEIVSCLGRAVVCVSGGYNRDALTVLGRAE